MIFLSNFNFKCNLNLIYLSKSRNFFSIARVTQWLKRYNYIFHDREIQYCVALRFIWEIFAKIVDSISISSEHFLILYSNELNVSRWCKQYFKSFFIFIVNKSRIRIRVCSFFCFFVFWLFVFFLFFLFDYFFFIFFF